MRPVYREGPGRSHLPGMVARTFLVTALPLIAELLDGFLNDGKEQLQTLTEAKDRPHLLDDDTVDRVKKVYTAQLDDLWIFDEQLARWNRGRLSVSQRKEVDRLVEVAGRLRKRLTEILDLSAELREGTIDRIMEKSDAEVAMEIMSGKLKPPW